MAVSYLLVRLFYSLNTLKIGEVWVLCLVVLEMWHDKLNTFTQADVTTLLVVNMDDMTELIKWVKTAVAGRGTIWSYRKLQ